MRVRHGGLSVPHLHPSRFAPGTCWRAPALSAVSSMSPESSVSGVVRVRLRARARVRGGTGVSSRLRAVWADEGGLFLLSLCFSLSFFYSLLILIALCHQPKLSSLRSARRLVLFTSYPSTARRPLTRWPISRDQRARSAPSGPSSHACPHQWASAPRCLGRQAGRTRGGWAYPCPACLLLGAPRCLCLHVPLAGLLCWGGRADIVHGTRLHPSLLPRPGRLSPPDGSQEWLGEVWSGESAKAGALDAQGAPTASTHPEAADVQV